MRPCTLTLVCLALAVPASPAHAEDDYRHGYIHGLEPGVTLQRATDAAAEEAVSNLPFLPGDRVWTDDSGRADFWFPDGSAVRLDRRSKLDYSSHEEGQEERIVLRLWSGSLILRNRSGALAGIEVETPSGLVQVTDRAVLRIDVADGETWLSAYEGQALFDSGRDSVELRAGERTWAPWGGEPAAPEPFDRYAADDFARWDADLEARNAYAANSERYLPPELDPYAADLDASGAWAYEPTAGYVWRPRVASGWVPYTNGYWAWTPPFGYTWVAYDPWGWAPFHYGRWGFSVSLGWYWTPGTVWGPGWVSWWVGGGRVAWCPLGRHGRPVAPWSRHGGYAVPRGSTGRGHGGARAALAGGWTMIRHDDLGRRDVARRRVSVDPQGLPAGRLAETGRERPTRDGLGLAERVVVPRAAVARPRPGPAHRTLPTSPGWSVGSQRSGRARPSSQPAARAGGATRRLPRGAGTTARPAPDSPTREATPSGIAGRRPRPAESEGDRGRMRSSPATRSPRALPSTSRPRPSTPAAPSSGTGSAGTPSSGARPRASRPVPSSESRPGATRSTPSSGSRPGATRSTPSSGSRPGATRSTPSSGSRPGATRSRSSGASRPQASRPAAGSRPRPGSSSGASSRSGGATRSGPAAGRSSSSRSGAARSGGSHSSGARPRPRDQ